MVSLSENTTLTLCLTQGCGPVWSLAKRKDLSEFKVTHRLLEDDIVEFERVITNAEDERLIQKFIEENPQLLTTLLTGNERYCMSQKRLGSQFVPDFVIGDVDSLGVRWILIELETPHSSVYIKNGSALEKSVRNGTDQIMLWRDWLSDNVAYARQSKLDNGLGLFGIREKCDAFVIVGRRYLMPKTLDAQRHSFRQDNAIHIHTYDWLLERLKGALRHQGPPATNSFLIHREEDPDWY